MERDQGLDDVTGGIGVTLLAVACDAIDAEGAVRLLGALEEAQRAVR